MDRKNNKEIRKNEKLAPVNLTITGVISVIILTILYGLGMYYNNPFLSGFGFAGNVVLVIGLCNLSYKKGLGKNKTRKK